MNNNEFEQFVLDEGKNILRFCRMTAGNEENGNELYQDTMLKLLEKLKKLDGEQNIKAYALSISIMLWKNKKKKFAVRSKIVSFASLEAENEENESTLTCYAADSAENEAILHNEAILVRKLVAELPEKLRIPLYLNYSAEMSADEIAKTLSIPLGTVKSRIRKAKTILKDKLEAIGYDR